MALAYRIKKISRPIWVPFFRITNQHKPAFDCPICGYKGAFLDINPIAGFRKHAQCPSCFSSERHRIQHLVMQEVLQQCNPAQRKMLHFAPEPFFRRWFSREFGQYETADLYMKGVDHQVDLQHLPFEDGSYDFVFASHVLEHIPDDIRAIQEIRRILKSGGIAVLPVPLVGYTTVEYPEPNPFEEYHLRAPGLDYFDRYEVEFSRVERISSEALPAQHQLFVYEDRSQYTKDRFPLRQTMQGEKHIDIVPICYV